MERILAFEPACNRAQPLANQRKANTETSNDKHKGINSHKLQNRFHRIASVFLLASIAQSATFYVSSPSATPAGSDSNAGTSAAVPFATVDHALNHSAFTCGDTLTVVANGLPVAGDANLPVWPGCVLTSTIQSSNLAMFAPVGYRTNPTNDAANYGKLSFTSQGLATGAEAHGLLPYNCNYVNFSSITITNPGVFTVSCASGLLMSIGSQVEFELNDSYPFVSPVLPAPLVLGQHYYVVAANFNCVVSAGCSTGSTFSISATPGGTPIQITACDSVCVSHTMAAAPVAVNTTDGTLTLEDAKISFPFTFVNGTPVAFSVAGFESYGTFPTGLSLNTTYYVRDKTATTFKVAATPSGAAIIPSTVGIGMLSVSNTNVQHHWAFRGLEFAPNGASLLGYLLQLGGSTESSAVGMVHNMEVDRCYMHGNDTPSGGSHNTLARHIFDNCQNCYIHDSYFSGATYSESQSIYGAAAIGPTFIVNNFLEGGSENTLYGGGLSTSGLPNSYHTFSGNYYYRPPIWKHTEGTMGVASGSCLYDATDPLRAGGEWLKDVGPIVNVNVGGGDSAYFIVTVSGGVITGISLYSGGESYTNGTYSTGFLGGWGGTGATASITASGGVIVSGTVSSGGSGYIQNQVAQCGSDFLWHATGAAYPVFGGAAKDLAEHKNGRYFTYTGNLLNYSWAAGQSGEAFNNSNEVGSGPGMSNDHITIMNNAMFHVYGFMTRTSQCGASANVPCLFPTSNHTAKNNLVVLDPLTCGLSFVGGYCGFASYSMSSDSIAPLGTASTFQNDTWDHNTLWAVDSYPHTLATIHWESPNGLCPHPVLSNNFTFQNNLPLADFDASCYGGGGAGLAIQASVSNGLFTHNALKASFAGYSTVTGTNTWNPSYAAYPADNAAVHFVNGTGTITGDYHLHATSNFSAANGSATLLSTDTTDLGADIDLVNMATSGAAAGTPSWDIKHNLKIIPGSTKALATLTSPGGVCTWTLYSAAPRNVAGNIVVSVADSAAAAIRDGTSVEIPVTGLTASTHYWYKMDCGGGVVMPGEFWTRAAGAVTTAFTKYFNTATAYKYCTDKAMSAGCVSLGAATAQSISVNPNSIVYGRQTNYTGLPNIILTP